MTIEIVNHTNTEPRIENFSKTRYVDPLYMEQEWDAIWRDSWLLAARC